MKDYPEINCGKCGQSFAVEQWTEGLPEKEFKCPGCGVRFKIIDGPPTRYPSGFIMPGKREVVVISGGAKC